MMFIVILHIYGHGSGLDYEKIYSFGNDWNTAWNLSLFSLGKIGVTGFMFISGYYGIKLSDKRLFHLIITCALFYVLLKLVFGGGSIIGILHPWDAWWFVGTYLIVCFLSPIIEIAFQKLDQKILVVVLASLLYIVYFIHFINGNNDHDLLLLLTIYIIARYIRFYPPQLLKRIKVWTCGISLFLIATIPIVIQMLYPSSHLQKIFLNNNNPLILVATATMVMLADSCCHKWPLLNRLTSGVLAIYLITEWGAVRPVFNQFMLPHVLNDYGLLLVPVVSIVCMLVGVLVNMMTNFLWDCFLKLRR